MLTILMIILIIVVAIETTIILVILNKNQKSSDEEIAEKVAEVVAAQLLAELKEQRQENLAEAREQRQEILSIIGKSNAQTAQLISTTSDATVKSMSELQTAIRDKVDERLDAIQKSNEQKLDEMRKTVDEKLETTLNARLKNSFEIVNQQLESVHSRLGEMKTVAESVANLNKALSGSKSKGILGELQLSQIIEDMLPPQLYERDAQMKKGSQERVEYAVKLPGQEDEGYVYLPIDSKFPLDNYYKLIEGYESGDTAAVEGGRKSLLAQIKESAKSVRAKYINPPYTTDFAVVFLPTEGLYAEAVRDAVFFEELRKEGIMLAGPTTLSALLSSLLVGFKTLQIQKGAVEIQHTLEKTKLEFGNFGSVLGKAQDRIRQTGEELDKLVGTRTRMINRALRDVQTYVLEDGEKVFTEIDIASADDDGDEESEKDGLV